MFSYLQKKEPPGYWNDPNVMLCQALGVNPKNVISLSASATVGELPTVTLEMYVEPNMFQQQTFTLTPKGGVCGYSYVEDDPMETGRPSFTS